MRLPVSLFLLLILFGAPTVSTASSVNSVAIIGAERTADATVLRELPFSQGSEWDDRYIETAERRLRNLGIFSEVVVKAPDEKGQVVITVKERWSLWLLPQASRKDNGASSVAAVMDEYNMWGLNHHLRFGYKRDTDKNFSGMKGTSYEGSYAWRRVADSKLSISLSGSFGYSRYDTYDLGVNTAQYQQRAKSGAIQFSYALDEVPDEGWSMSAGFSGSNSVYRLLGGTPQADVIGHRMRAINFGAAYSAVDDRITWITGSQFNFSTSVAHRSLGSTMNSYTHLASWSRYYNFSGQNTFNIRLNGGLKTGNTLRSGIFDIGNRNGLRGYYPGELQGTHYLYGTFEGRFPLHDDSNVQIVTFSDVGKIGGNVGTSVTRNLAVGFGGGVRWTLRWLAKGTIRGDVAYGMSTKRWRFYLGTGQAF